jgi:hypothetical protein
MKKCTPRRAPVEVDNHPAQLLIPEARRNSSLNKLCGGTNTFM